MNRLPKERRPNLLCIGAPKAGTTWLASVLAAHPDIFMPPQKELNALHYDDLEDRLQEYSCYFLGGEKKQIRCDFSVRYLASLNAVEAAARYAPDTRILAILRNPVDQVQSHYWHLRRQNFHQAAPIHPAPDLFEALERFPDLLLEPALYGKHLTRWIEKFPRERILVVTYEDLMFAKEAFLNRICEFLDLSRRNFSGDIAMLSSSDGRGGVRPREGLLGFLYPKVYVNVTRYGLIPLKRLLGVRRVETIKRTFRLRQLGESVFFTPGYEKLGSDGRNRLWRYFSGDVKILENVTGLSLDHWHSEFMGSTKSSADDAVRRF